MNSKNFDAKLVSDILASKKIVREPIAINSEAILLYPSQRPSGFGLSQYSFNAFLKLGDKLIIGCGEDSESKSVALEKAISEVIERAVLKLSTSSLDVRTTSNGWAAHTNLESAATAAVFELIERDSAISHWLTKTPMMVLEAEAVYPQRFISEIKNAEFPKVINLVSFNFSGPLVTTFLTNASGFVISGHASGKSLREAVFSSTIEACRAAHHFLRYSYFLETKSLIHDDYIHEKVDPGAHSLMYAYHQPISKWIFGESISLEDAEINWQHSFKSVYESLAQTSFTSYTAADRIVVQAKNKNLQDVFWGSTYKAIMDQKINHSLLKRTINFQPHLVG